jgi:hypothetical protein
MFAIEPTGVPKPTMVRAYWTKASYEQAFWIFSRRRCSDRDDDGCWLWQVARVKVWTDRRRFPAVILGLAWLEGHSSNLNRSLHEWPCMPPHIARLRNVFLLPVLAQILSGCAALDSLGGPPTGWVSKDPATHTGVYLYKDGNRYEGGYQDDALQGKGTISYDWVTQGSYPYQMHGSRITAEFNNDKFAGDGQITFAKVSGYQPFTYVGNGPGGFRDAGVVTFADGRRFEGKFSNVPTLYAYQGGKDQWGSPIYYWNTNNLIGSKFSGHGVMTWPNGAVFEGAAYDYYLFNRASKGAICAESVFYGVGTLRVPGKASYTGLVRESDDHKSVGPASKDAFKDYVEDIEQCGPNLLAEQARLDGFQASQAAEIRQANDEASESLRNELAKLPGKMRNDMARLDAAGRGTTLEWEREKAERQIKFNAIISGMEADPNNNLNKGKRAPERTTTSGERQGDARRPAARDADEKPNIACVSYLNETAAGVDTQKAKAENATIRALRAPECKQGHSGVRAGASK